MSRRPPLEDEFQQDVAARPHTLWARMLTWVIGTLVCVAALYGAAHFVLVKIPPEQRAPEGHFGEPCNVCHVVSDSAEPIEIER